MKWLMVALSILILLAATSGCNQQKAVENDVYNPVINPGDFSSEINNKYFSLPVGVKIVYESQTDEGIERIELLIPGWTRNIMGVDTLVFWDKVYLAGVIVEDTRDYLAQDKEGNVWYFGEDVDNYEDGKLRDHNGAWVAGVDGAKPGIWMKAIPNVGDEYRQEYYRGKAEDMAKVVEIGVSVTTPYGSFNDCVKILEWSPLEKATAYKYHCGETGGTVLEEEDDERVELIDIVPDGAKNISLPAPYEGEGVLA